MRAALALGLLSLLAAPEAARAQPAHRPQGQPGQEGQRLRRELRAMEALLDQTVAQVSRPNPGFVLAGAPASRGYLLRGHGVVFVLAPRRLPMSPLAMTRTQQHGHHPGFGQANDLRQLEVQVAEFQAQVQQDWQALEQSFDEVQARIWAAAPENANPNRPWRVVGSRPGPAPAEAPMGAAPPRPPGPPARALRRPNHPFPRRRWRRLRRQVLPIPRPRRSRLRPGPCGARRRPKARSPGLRSASWPTPERRCSWLSKTMGTS